MPLNAGKKLDLQDERVQPGGAGKEVLRGAGGGAAGLESGARSRGATEVLKGAGGVAEGRLEGAERAGEKGPRGAGRQPKTAADAQESAKAHKDKSKNNKVVYMSPQVTQFELTKALYASGFLAEANLTATCKLVLFGLISHYNHKNADVFPSQRYLARQLGISEKSIERAVKELVAEKYVVYTTQKVNHYSFTPFFFTSVKLSEYVRQNVGGGCRQNVGQTYKHENKINTTQGVKNMGIAGTPRSAGSQSFAPSGFSYAYRHKTDAYWKKEEISGGTAVPSVEQTSAMLEEFRQQRQNACSPLDFDLEQAQRWFDAFKSDKLHLMNFAVKLRQKHGIALPQDVRQRLLSAGVINESYE